VNAKVSTPVSRNSISNRLSTMDPSCHGRSIRRRYRLSRRTVGRKGWNLSSR
jgi:hypothetical protein